MTVVLHPGARQDIDDAAAFYEREGSRAVAIRFLAQVERVAMLLLANPGACKPRTRDRRGFSIAGFPYTIVYPQMLAGIHVLVVKPDKRRPSYGGGRR